jgi:hypothetical protein
LAKAYHHYYLTHELKLMATSLETPAWVFKKRNGSGRNIWGGFL